MSPLRGSPNLAAHLAVSRRVRVASRDDRVWVGVDAFGKGGAEIIKGKVNVTNGVLLGISDVLTVPPDLATVLAHEPSVSYFHNILTPEITKVPNSTAELTIFLPVDSAWDELESLERLYLESEFATDDLHRILNMHAVVDKTVTWSDSFDPAVNLTTIDSKTLEVVITPDKTTISTADLIQPDAYASNGILHLVSSLLIPEGALLLTPEKYLLALNCTSFVSLLHSVDLTTLINSTDTKFTILAPCDDVLSVFGDWDLPEKGSEELKRFLQYHFLPGRWTPKKLRDGMLLETVLQDEGLDGGRRVGVEVSDDLKGDRNVRFAGAGTIGDHVEINNTLIYFISRPSVPPTDALETALPKLDFSSFLAAIFSTSLADTLKTTPRTAFLIPHSSAFKRVGLVSEYLLIASSKSDLESVILHHVIDGIEYAQNLNGSQHTFPTLEGSDIKLEWRQNQSSINSGSRSILVTPGGGWAGMKAAPYARNTLTSTGVVHELSDLMIRSCR
jgi:solute carrier family 25 carnitine/acylcarnitine transporter 20/29